MINSATASRIAAITNSPINAPVTPNATPPANSSATARWSPSPTSANPNSALVVTFTAATTFENAHGNISSPTAAPTSRASDCAGCVAAPEMDEAV